MAHILVIYPHYRLVVFVGYTVQYYLTAVDRRWPCSQKPNYRIFFNFRIHCNNRSKTDANIGYSCVMLLPMLLPILPHDACVHSAVSAAATCLSVVLSVCHTDVFLSNRRIPLSDNQHCMAEVSHVAHGIYRYLYVARKVDCFIVFLQISSSSSSSSSHIHRINCASQRQSYFVSYLTSVKSGVWVGYTSWLMGYMSLWAWLNTSVTQRCYRRAQHVCVCVCVLPPTTTH